MVNKTFSISIDEKIVEELDSMVENSHDYSSRSHAITVAILDLIKKNNKPLEVISS